MRVNQKTYEEGYRPRIVYAQIRVSYYPENLRVLARSNPKRVRASVKEFISDLTSVVIDEENLIPTEKMHQALIKRIWPYSEQLLKDSFAWVSEIVISKELSRVNYKFNQNIH
jgi:hypothetical protein